MLKWVSKILFADKENRAKILLDSKSDMIDVKDDDGYTPLMLVAKFNGIFPFEIETF